MLATGFGNTVVSPVGVPPAGGGGGGAAVVPAVVVALDVVELVLVVAVVVLVAVVAVVLVVVVVVAPALSIHCEYHSLAAVQTHPLGQTLAPVHPLPPPVGVSWGGFCKGDHGGSLTLAVWGGRALGADGERAEGDEDRGGEGVHRGTGVLAGWLE